MSRFTAARPLIVGIDGRSGSGKTVLSTVLAENLAADHEVTVLRLENLYPGWNGLLGGIKVFGEDVLPKLAAGEPATYPTWDWNAGSPEGSPGPEVTTEPTEVIICEGVGVGARQHRGLLDVLIWLRVPDQVRYERAMSRDGENYRGEWANWAAQERRLLDQDQIYDAADLVLVANEPDERHHTSALAVVHAMLNPDLSPDSFAAAAGVSPTEASEAAKASESSETSAASKLSESDR